MGRELIYLLILYNKNSKENYIYKHINNIFVDVPNRNQIQVLMSFSDH